MFLKYRNVIEVHIFYSIVLLPELSFLQNNFFFEFQVTQEEGITLTDRCIALEGLKNKDFSKLNQNEQGRVIGCINREYVSVLPDFHKYFKMGIT